jgi:hypothetical protein
MATTPVIKFVTRTDPANPGTNKKYNDTGNSEVNIVAPLNFGSLNIDADTWSAVKVVWGHLTDLGGNAMVNAMKFYVDGSFNNQTGGDAQRTFIPILQWGTARMSNIQKATLLTLNVAYWLWVDDDTASPDKGNGLCIMIKPDSAGGLGWSTWTYTNSVCFNMEKLNSKEFSDGYSLWHFMSLVNYVPWAGGNQNALTRKWAWILHPWASPATDDTIGDANDFYYLTQTWWGQRPTGLNTFENYGIKGIDFPVWAALSQGGSPPNVYFMKGIIHAEPRYNNKPIGTIQHCFPWREGTGIVDQDIISEPSPSTTKYVCLGKESASNATRLTMAIKYAY